eukprot:15353620-Ditylum_brightwellii.AAC.1
MAREYCSDGRKQTTLQIYRQDDKEGKLETWFPQAIDKPKVWECQRRARQDGLNSRLQALGTQRKIQL